MIKLSLLQLGFLALNIFMHLSMVCPRMGVGGGGGKRATHGKFDMFSFQMSISPPLGLHFETNSHPWGELIGTHNSRYCSTERPESNNYLVTKK